MYRQNVDEDDETCLLNQLLTDSDENYHFQSTSVSASRSSLATSASLPKFEPLNENLNENQNLNQNENLNENQAKNNQIQPSSSSTLSVMIGSEYTQN